jgi:hypothetical protein
MNSLIETIDCFFIGNENDLKKEPIFRYLDPNYLPLNNILLSYYTTLSPNTTDNELIDNIDRLNNINNIYNKYNIYPLLISIIIIIIAISIIILRYLFLQFYHMYSYILIFIILSLIIIGSIWFLYINNETL